MIRELQTPPCDRLGLVAVHRERRPLRRTALPRLATFFYAQAVEERNHAMMMVRYRLDADAMVTIRRVAAPETQFADVVAPVVLALEQE